ncbi:hypothetical protein EZS27_015622 [termite gut metagenome]|uniref:Uncharacterized protein n=1 Tax=termite gut metagenome TaxID=433724 RepID=A0A5J4RQL4_9ZZZZ
MARFQQGSIISMMFSTQFSHLLIELTLSCYEIMEASAGYLFHCWLEEQNLSGVRRLYSSDISKLHASIGGNQKVGAALIGHWIEALQAHAWNLLRYHLLFKLFLQKRFC